jgi:nuclear GTP-binding protein
MGKATMQAKGKGKGIVEDVEMELQEGIPILINRDLPNLQSVLDQADVILQVLDARDPLAFRSSHLEELTAAKLGRRMLFVLNKIGLFIVMEYTTLL